VRGERQWSGRDDARYALTTLALALVTGGFVALLLRAGAIVLPLAWPSVWTFVREAMAYVILFEVYFYGLHRLLHRRVLFARIHAVHHRSHSPTVVTGLTFHPVEALLIIAFVPIALWLMPIHVASLAIVSTFLSGSILLAHSGREPFPPWWEQVPVLNWYVTPSMHARHHARGDCNYSATLSFCDRAFGTWRREPPRPGTVAGLPSSR